MKKFAWLFCVAIAMAMPAHTQTFLDHLRKNVPGQGTVTVTQSKEIDELINGNQPKKTPVTTEPKKEIVKKETAIGKTEPTKKENKKPQHILTGDSTKTATNKVEPTEKPVERHETPATKTEPVKKQQEEGELDIPTIDMRKKVMRGSHKITGYRVQAFSGGNSRLDRQKAEQASTAIKMKYTDQPVYVHFYSPHWICRVGNYRSFEEAETMLRKVKALGYRQACIVRGKIIVQD